LVCILWFWLSEWEVVKLTGIAKYFGKKYNCFCISLP
jgi:hypothetical protein